MLTNEHIVRAWVGALWILMLINEGTATSSRYLAWPPHAMSTNLLINYTMPMSIARASKFLEGEQGDMHIPLEWNKHKNLPSRKDIKYSIVKTTMSILGIMQHPSCSSYLSFYNVSHTNLGSSIECIWCKHECQYEPTHARSIIHGCLAKLSIKKLYTWLDLAKITFYHWSHTQGNGEPTHGKHDPQSTWTCMNRYTLWMS